MGIQVVDQRTQYAQFLIKRISKAGSIRVDNGVLSVSPESCEKMVAGYEAEIVQVLQKQTEPKPAPVTPVLPEGATCIRSKVLGGEQIVVVPDSLFPESGKFGNMVAYSESEIKRIKEGNPDGDEVRFLHTIKKEFGGQIIKREEQWQTF